MSSIDTKYPRSKSPGKFHLFISQLYEFLFRNQKGEFTVSAIAIILALIYATINTLTLGRPKEVVAYEGSLIAAIIFVTLVFAYCYGVVKSTKDSSNYRETRSESNEENIKLPEKTKPISSIALQNAFTSYIADLAKTVRTIEGYIEAQRKSQESLVRAISEISETQRYIRSTALAELADVIATSQKELIANFVENMNKSLQDAVAKLSEQQRIDIETVLSHVIENPKEHSFTMGVGELVSSPNEEAELDSSKPEYDLDQKEDVYFDVDHQKSKDAKDEAEYIEAINRHPNHASSHFVLGNILLRQKKYAEAEAAYREAIRLEPDNITFISFLCSLLNDQGKYAEAEAAYREAIRLKPNDATAHNNLGHILYMQKQYAEAEAEFRQAIELRPSDALFRSNLGEALYEQGKYAEAEAAYREAIRLEPDSVEFKEKLDSLLQE